MPKYSDTNFDAKLINFEQRAKQKHNLFVVTRHEYVSLQTELTQINITAMKKLLLCVFATLSAVANAQVKMLPIFTDNMVLQQQSDAPIWGTTKPNKTVKLTTSWDGKTYQMKTDASGGWRFSLATPSAGGPYSITIDDGKKVVLQNVMIGEVWLCSGQSNMEMSVGQVKNKDAEIKEASQYPNIRLFHVQNTLNTRPQTDLKAVADGWEVCSADCIERFSACGYFFGRELNKHLDTPIGLIESCWGGTLAEAWTSGEALSQMPYFRPVVESLPGLPESAEERVELYKRETEQWWDELRSRDQGYADGKAPWAAVSANEAEWGDIKTPGYWQNNGLAGINGIVWLRKTIEIPAAWEGKELTLNLGPIDDEDNTFFNGVEIGHTDLWFAPRNYKIPATLVKAGKAVIAIRVTDSGGNGGCWSSDNDFNIACDGENINIAGQWKYMVAADMRRMRPMPVNTAMNPNLPTVLYNAMLHPIIPYAIKGAIWYQGESNSPQAYQYRELLPLMITDWRNKWGYDFPFYIVQLANYQQVKDQPAESTWAELREAQIMTLNLKNTGQACIIDIGEADDIHPKNKQEVGRRLALAARAQTYGENIAYEGPMYDGYTIDGEKVTIRFRAATGGLTTNDGKAPRTFQIAGPDHKFVWADARIEGSTVVVSSPEVRFPTAVRYAWADNPDCNLFNAVGLPASPFRTDDWPGITLIK